MPVWRPAASAFRASKATTVVADPADVKTLARITTDDEDALILALCRVAQGRAEALLNRLIVRRACTLVLPGFPRAGEWIELPGGDVQDLTSFSYHDGTAETPVPAATYLVTPTLPARVELADGQIWPSPVRAAGLPVKIVYDAGWLPDEVPDEVAHAVARIAAELYDRRGETVGEDLNEVPLDAAALLEPHRIWSA